MSDEEWSQVHSYPPASRPIRFVKAKTTCSSAKSQPLSLPDGKEISAFYSSLTSEVAVASVDSSSPTQGLILQFCEACRQEVPDWPSHSGSIGHMLNADSSQPKPPTYYSIKSNNPGRRMLEESGWDSEVGLGLHGQGRKIPLRPVEKSDRLGIGLSLPKSNPSDRPKTIASPRLKGKGSVRHAKADKAETDQWRAMRRYLNE